MKSSASEPGLTVRRRSRRAAKLNISGKRTGLVRACHWNMLSLSETCFLVDLYWLGAAN